MTTQAVLAAAGLRIRRHGKWITIEADWGIGGIGTDDPSPAEHVQRKQVLFDVAEHAASRCFLLGHPGEWLFYAANLTGWSVTAPREDELSLVVALFMATAGDFRAAHAYLALPGRRVVASGVGGD